MLEKPAPCASCPAYTAHLICCSINMHPLRLSVKIVLSTLRPTLRPREHLKPRDSSLSDCKGYSTLLRSCRCRHAQANAQSLRKRSQSAKIEAWGSSRRGRWRRHNQAWLRCRHGRRLMHSTHSSALASSL